MTEDEARRSGLPLSVGGASGDGSGRGYERAEAIHGRDEMADVGDQRPPVVRVPVRAPSPELLVSDQGNVPEQEPAPEVPGVQISEVKVTLTQTDPPAPAAAPAAAPVTAAQPPETLEERIAKARAVLEGVGYEVKAVPAIPPTGVEATADWTDTLSPEQMLALLKRPCIAVRAWRESIDLARCLNRFLTGVRTFLFFGTVGILSLLDSFQVIDMRAVFKIFFPALDDLSIANILTLISVMGVMLHLLTSTPVFRRWRRTARSGGDGLAPGVGTGSVDEPEGDH